MTDTAFTSRFFTSDPALVEVGVGDLVIGQHPQRLLTLALGSCVGVALWDASTHRGGLAHVMLPAPTTVATEGTTGRFASTAVPELVSMLVQAGSARHHLRAKIAGGAAMFRREATIAHIGQRNVAEVKRQLSLMSVPLVAEDTGETHARTVELFLDTGVLFIRSYRFGDREI